MKEMIRDSIKNALAILALSSLAGCSSVSRDSQMNIGGLVQYVIQKCSGQEDANHISWENIERETYQEY